MTDVPEKTAEEEHRFHQYTGNAIPWYVRLIWVLFWCFIVYYGISYFPPYMQSEVLSPP